MWLTHKSDESSEGEGPRIWRRDRMNSGSGHGYPIGSGVTLTDSGCGNRPSHEKAGHELVASQRHRCCDVAG